MFRANSRSSSRGWGQKGQENLGKLGVCRTNWEYLGVKTAEFFSSHGQGKTGICFRKMIRCRKMQCAQWNLCVILQNHAVKPHPADWWWIGQSYSFVPQLCQWTLCRTRSLARTALCAQVLETISQIPNAIDISSGSNDNTLYLTLIDSMQPYKADWIW